MRAAVPLAVLVAVWLGAAVAHAETCPEVPDDEVALRRSMAKEWFAKAEESEASGDRQAAVRRYACSLNLAPHPSTAYNLGTVAEKSGDLAMAVDGFRTYLKLATEATDRPAIEARIMALEAKISELRKLTPKPETGAAVPAATTPTTPPPFITQARAPSDDGAPTRRVVGWVSAGVGTASLAAGVVLNLMARSKMDQCYSQFAARKSHAIDLCNDAKPLAYGSYAAFGAAGALGLASAVLFIWSPGGGAGEETTTTPSLSFAPGVGGGGALLATGRF
jgi:hypothetical protein